ncbi:odorant receptor 65a [Drosophila busckii]|uniref:odorant receptor 65a n=1 Tax=Drosophila busckii TaxID=30019 RepID=UPI00083F027A|nr:odorant receptor 65a [Drosophila busckii]
MEFGMDALWIIGGFYILIKMSFVHFNSNELNELLDQLDELHEELNNEPGQAAAYEQRAWYFQIESGLAIIWHCGLGLFNLLVISLPLWTQQKLPFHAVYPFSLQDPDKHPYGHVFVFIWQCLSFSYNLIGVVEVDVITSHMFPQLAANLKVLCVKLQSFAPEFQNNKQRFDAELKCLIQFHQRVITHVNRTNKVLYVPQIAQITSGFLQICLSAFVSLAVKNNPAVYKFILFLVLSLGYVSYWCALGNMVTSQSMEVAAAAWGTVEYAPFSREIQRNIAFMLQRAQIPLLIQAPPFPPINRASNMYLFKQSYSILTVLLNTLD